MINMKNKMNIGIGIILLILVSITAVYADELDDAISDAMDELEGLRDEALQEDEKLIKELVDSESVTQQQLGEEREEDHREFVESIGQSYSRGSKTKWIWIGVIAAFALYMGGVGYRQWRLSKHGIPGPPKSKKEQGIIKDIQHREQEKTHLMKQNILLLEHYPHEETEDEAKLNQRVEAYYKHLDDMLKHRKWGSLKQLFKGHGSSVQLLEKWAEDFSKDLKDLESGLYKTFMSVFKKIEAAGKQEVTEQTFKEALKEMLKEKGSHSIIHQIIEDINTINEHNVRITRQLHELSDLHKEDYKYLNEEFGIQIHQHLFDEGYKAVDRKIDVKKDTEQVIKELIEKANPDKKAALTKILNDNKEIIRNILYIQGIINRIEKEILNLQGPLLEQEKAELAKEGKPDEKRCMNLAGRKREDIELEIKLLQELLAKKKIINAQISYLEAETGAFIQKEKSKSNAYLIGIEDEIKGKHEIKHGEFHVGHKSISTNNLKIDDSYVSRNHMRIIREGDDYYAQDLGGTNGTWVNGTKITEGEKVKLNDQDRIGLCIGKTEKEHKYTFVFSRSGKIVKEVKKKS